MKTIIPRGIILSHSIESIQTNPATGTPEPLDIEVAAHLEARHGFARVGSASETIAARLTFQRFYGLGKRRVFTADSTGASVELLADKNEDQAYPVREIHRLDFSTGEHLLKRPQVDDESFQSVYPSPILQFFQGATDSVDSYRLRKEINAWIKRLGGVSMGKGGSYWLPVECLDDVEDVRSLSAHLGVSMSVACIDQGGLEDHANAAMRRLASINHDLRGDLKELVESGDREGAIKKLDQWRSDVQGAAALLDAVDEAKSTLEGLYDEALETITGASVEDLEDLEETTEEGMIVEDLEDLEDLEPVKAQDPEPEDLDLDDLDLDFL